MAATITWDTNPITAGRDGIAAFAGIASPTLLDWIGMHRVGAAAGDFVAWGLIAPEATLALGTGYTPSSGAVEFTVPPSTPAGSHTVQLFRGYQGVMLAESAAFTVNAYDNIATLTAPASVSRNSVLPVTWANIPSVTVRRVALTVAGHDPDSDALTRLTSNFGTASGTLDLYIPNDFLTGTTYKLRLYTLQEQAPRFYIESADITITAEAASTIASPGDQLAGTLVQAQWANIVSPAPSTQDWVGLFALGAPASAPLGYRYLNGTASGSLPFVIPGYLPTDTYELRLYSGADQSLLATSDPFTVTAAP
jgi:hypothetical protein